MDFHDEPTQGQKLFDPWSGQVIDSWVDFVAQIEDIHKRHGSNRLFWRGVPDSRWGAESSLYRRLKLIKNTVTELEMVDAEKYILKRARQQWRFEHLDAMEIFAHIQHYGGPARLLDVTGNPYIASWFAVERQRKSNGDLKEPVESRLFCFPAEATLPVTRWGGQAPIWHEWKTSAQRKENNWGNGRGRRFWRPPAYNERIPAQNGAFLLDGVPVGNSGNQFFSKAPQNPVKWTMDELRAGCSIPIRLSDPSVSRKSKVTDPVYSLRISAKAREEIRTRLEQNFGYSEWTMYGDLFGLAKYAYPELPVESDCEPQKEINQMRPTVRP